MTAARPLGELARTYLVADHGLTITTDRADLADEIGARLRGFGAPPGAAAGADLRVEFRAVASAEAHAVEPPRPGARPVYDSALVTTLYDDRLDRLHLACGTAARAACSPREGRAVVSYVESAAGELGWLLSHALLTVSLMEMLKRRGVYALHAAAMARGGSAVLFAGASGSGKTTLALALARAGFDFLGDDLALLAPAGGDLRVLAFPDQIDVTAETAGLLPELGPFLRRAPTLGRRKHGVFIQELYPAAVPPAVVPGVLFLPSVSRDGRTRVEPVAASRVLLELAPNVLLTERASAQAHLDALARLVAESRCYRLETGRDLAAVSEIVGALAAG